jgi:hypothetical protein
MNVKRESLGMRTFANSLKDGFYGSQQLVEKWG